MKFQIQITLSCHSPQRVEMAPVRQKENKRKLRLFFRSSFQTLGQGLALRRNVLFLLTSVSKLGKVSLLFKDEVFLCRRLTLNSDLKWVPLTQVLTYLGLQSQAHYTWLWRGSPPLLNTSSLPHIHAFRSWRSHTWFLLSGTDALLVYPTPGPHVTDLCLVIESFIQQAPLSASSVFLKSQDGKER